MLLIDFPLKKYNKIANDNKLKDTFCIVWCISRPNPFYSVISFDQMFSWIRRFLDKLSYISWVLKVNEINLP